MWGPGLVCVREDPRGFPAQPGWAHRVPSEHRPHGGGDDPPLAGNVERLSKMYPKISKAQNAELRLRWCQIILKNNLEAEYGKVKDFLHSQVRPSVAVAVLGGKPLGERWAPEVLCQRARGWLLLLIDPENGLLWKGPSKI